MYRIKKFQHLWGSASPKGKIHQTFPHSVRFGHFCTSIPTAVLATHCFPGSEGDRLRLALRSWHQQMDQQQVCRVAPRPPVQVIEWSGYKGQPHRGDARKVPTWPLYAGDLVSLHGTKEANARSWSRWVVDKVRWVFTAFFVVPLRLFAEGSINECFYTTLNCFFV